MKAKPKPPARVKKPALAFVLVLLGAVITIIGSLQLYLGGNTPAGAMGLLAGALVLASSILLYRNKLAKIKQWSSTALLAAFISTGAFYYVYFGFILSVIGGMLGLTYGDNIESRDIFMFVLLGGLGVFLGSIMIIGITHDVLPVLVGMAGSFLGIFVIKYSTNIYSENIIQVQKTSMLTLTAGVVSIAIDMLAISIASSILLTVGIIAGTMLIISGSFSGAVRPNFVASYAPTYKRRS